MTLAIGKDVPWNAGWSGEERWEVRPCRFAGGRPALWQPHLPGTGRPQFADPHIVRQRRSIAEMRCTVCGERTPASNRYWFEHGTFHEQWFMTLESPVHLACADLSMRVCPHIRKLGLRPHPFPAGASVLAATIRPESLMDIYGLPSPPGGVIGHLKLAFPASSIRRAPR